MLLSYALIYCTILNILYTFEDLCIFRPIFSKLQWGLVLIEQLCARQLCVIRLYCKYNLCHPNQSFSNIQLG